MVAAPIQHLIKTLKRGNKFQMFGDTAQTPPLVIALTGAVKNTDPALGAEHLRYTFGKLKLFKFYTI